MLHDRSSFITDTSGLKNLRMTKAAHWDSQSRRELLCAGRLKFSLLKCISLFLYSFLNSRMHFYSSGRMNW